MKRIRFKTTVVRFKSQSRSLNGSERAIKELSLVFSSFFLLQCKQKSRSTNIAQCSHHLHAHFTHKKMTWNICRLKRTTYLKKHTKFECIYQAMIQKSAWPNGISLTRFKYPFILLGDRNFFERNKALNDPTHLNCCSQLRAGKIKRHTSVLRSS